MITQTFIDDLICYQKQILKSDKKQMWLENRHYRNNFALESCDKKFSFRVFLRRSDDFIEDFSVGLVWLNASQYISITKPIILLRCQGPHDGKEEIGTNTHYSFHTHEITVEDIASRRYTKPSKRSSTTAFSSFQSALWYFVSRCGIIDVSKFDDFADVSQLSIDDFFEGGDYDA